MQRLGEHVRQQLEPDLGGLRNCVAMPGAAKKIERLGEAVAAIAAVGYAVPAALAGYLVEAAIGFQLSSVQGMVVFPMRSPPSQNAFYATTRPPGSDFASLCAGGFLSVEIDFLVPG
jgi:hypothetical protein